MKNLVIIGARGWGREVYFAATRIAEREKITVKGFLDEKADAFDGLEGQFPPILGSVENYEIQENDIFFCALGEPYYRKKYVDMIRAKGGKFMTIISPETVINPTAKIGEGSFIGRNVFISDNVVLGEHTTVLGLCTLGHDVKVGNFVTIEAYSFLGGFSEVGDMSSIHVRSTIILKKKVGANCSVGACSVVVRNVKDGYHVYGNPAMKIE